MSNFKEYSKCYDLVYKQKDYKTESEYIKTSLNEFDSDIKTVLELGCGSGGHAKFLAESGLKVTGIERSDEMVAEAKLKNIKNFNPIVGDITNFNLKASFDAVISIFHVISYLTDNSGLIKCFKSVHKHLKKNGLFLFDFWYSPAVLCLKPETRVKRFEDEKISIIRIAEPTSNFNTNTVDVNFEIHIIDKSTKSHQILNEVHPMRHFSLPELDLLAKLTGFELVQGEEFLSKNVPDEKTWGVCVIFKKI